MGAPVDGNKGAERHATPPLGAGTQAEYHARQSPIIAFTHGPSP